MPARNFERERGRERKWEKVAITLQLLDLEIQFSSVRERINSTIRMVFNSLQQTMDNAHANNLNGMEIHFCQISKWNLANTLSASDEDFWICSACSMDTVEGHLESNTEIILNRRISVENCLEDCDRLQNVLTNNGDGMLARLTLLCTFRSASTYWALLVQICWASAAWASGHGILLDLIFFTCSDTNRKANLKNQSHGANGAINKQMKYT